MPDLDAWGIARGYHDITGAWREPPPRTVDAITNAMGIETDQPPPGPALWIVRQGEEVSLGGRWELVPDDGGSDLVSGTLPPLEPGYYRAFHEDGRGLRLIVTPGRCHLPADLRIWGWAVQLYALRSRQSWGMGDLADLARFAGFAKGQGAGLVLLNPLHASTPVEHQQESPYYPSSRCFRNPLYLRIEDVPGADFRGSDLDTIANDARALNGDRRIDRQQVFRHKLDALTRVFAAVPPGDGFDAFVDAGGDTLQRYATHCVLAETYGPNWRQWPDDYRNPTSWESRQVRDQQAGRVRFHMWLQWLLDQQLERAGSALDLMQDLAIGVDPGGADAWMWQDVLAPDMSVGAPADDYNRQGQDWGLPPFDPWKLRDAFYEPFIQTVRAGLRHAGGLRFDHVMGLFRLFWIPSGGSAREGTYVRYPFGDLLDILAVESHRAGAYVVGEDLGTVEDYMREELARRDVLSYRLFWFEPGPPREFPERALAAITTHDLPTVAGLWSGSDLDAQKERSMEPNEEGAADLRRKIASAAGAGDDAAIEDVVVRLHDVLAEAPSMIVTATIDDALCVEERPNYPGTTGGTNWSLALPVPLEEIEEDARVAAVARALQGR
ncbi:MAG TPA: 4-alpha-glucanotransferase [Acidimicrobiales bacterium]